METQTIMQNLMNEAPKRADGDPASAWIDMLVSALSMLLQALTNSLEQNQVSDLFCDHGRHKYRLLSSFVEAVIF